MVTDTRSSSWATLHGAVDAGNSQLGYTVKVVATDVGPLARVPRAILPAAQSVLPSSEPSLEGQERVHCKKGPHRECPKAEDDVEYTDQQWSVGRYVVTGRLPSPVCASLAATLRISSCARSCHELRCQRVPGGLPEVGACTLFLPMRGKFLQLRSITLCRYHDAHVILF